MSVTIRDVARRAGVSPITVSRTFSGTHRVAPKTRRLVLQAAKQLGYAPDLLAQGLVRKQSSIIGVVVLELANPFFAPVIDAIHAVARDKEHMVLISQSNRRPELEQASLKQFRQIRVAGVLVTLATTQLEHLHYLESQGTHVVLVARRWEMGDYVAINDQLGGRLVGEHLLRIGHRKFACVALDEPHNSANQARVQGIAMALKESGLSDGPPVMICTKTERLADGLQAADSFLEQPDQPSAVFVTTDRMAIGFVHRLRERGVDVPRDVAVVGYDDIRYAEFMQVPLTTVALPKYEMGQLAAQILFERIENVDASAQPHQVLLQPQLLVRASCGANS